MGQRAQQPAFSTLSTLEKPRKMSTPQNALSRPVLTVRVHAGLNASSLLAGLFSVSGMGLFCSADEFLQLRFPNAEATLEIKPTSICGITGVTAVFKSPAEGHVHRTPAAILQYYEKACTLSPAALEIAANIWLLLAKAEARVHNASLESVHFHEVGRMTNILAVGLIAEIFASINPISFVSSALPLADGTVRCAHGMVPNPAPATLAQLEGVAVRPYDGNGETVTPTGLAILKGLGAQFGAWPSMRITRQVTAFAPGKTFEGANGLVMALGQPL